MPVFFNYGFTGTVPCGLPTIGFAARPYPFATEQTTLGQYYPAQLPLGPYVEGTVQAIDTFWYGCYFSPHLILSQTRS